MLRFVVAEFIFLGIGNIDVCSMSNTSGRMDYFGDKLVIDKADEITLCSVNINRLRMEGWKAKNNQVRDFVLSSKADIVAF